MSMEQDGNSERPFILPLEEIVADLKTRKYLYKRDRFASSGGLLQVARETGISYTILREIADGKPSNPRYSTLKTLSLFIRDNPMPEREKKARGKK